MKAALEHVLRSRWPEVQDVLSIHRHPFVFPDAVRCCVLAAGAVGAAVILQPELVAVLVSYLAYAEILLVSIDIGVRAVAD